LIRVLGNRTYWPVGYAILWPITALAVKLSDLLWSR